MNKNESYYINTHTRFKPKASIIQFNYLSGLQFETLELVEISQFLSKFFHIFLRSF